MQILKGLGIGLLGVLLIAPTVFARNANDPKANNWALNQIGAPRAWDISTGSSDVVVAIIDNGFDYLHPELFPNTWKNIDEIAGNGIDDDKNGYVDDVWGWDFSIVDRNGDGDITDPEDIRGDNNPRPDIASGEMLGSVSTQVIHHGSIVAGIIGAKGNNGRDGTGVNWDVQLMNIRLIGNSGFAEQTSIAESIYYAVDNGADIINFSLVTQELGGSAQDALEYAYDNGVVVVSAAGNDRIDLEQFPYYPICNDEDAVQQEILGVSAISEGRGFADFSNYGSNCIDITAPGVGLEGTLVYAPEAGLKSTYGGLWQGTSFAAPFVSGAAALIKSVQPNWGPDEIFKTLQSTTSKTPSDDPEGYQDLFGSGLLQLDKALEQAIAAAPKEEVVSRVPSIQTVSFSQGSSRLKSPAALGLAKITSAESLNNIDDIDQLFFDNAYWYAGTKYDPETGLVTVQVLDESFTVVDEWTKPATGAYDVAFADFAPGLSGFEVALAPQHANDEIYTLYSQKGTQIASDSLSGEHAGVVVAVSMMNAERTPEVVVAYQQEPGVSTVRRYDVNADALLEFSVQSVESIGSIIAADIDGDRVDEYVVASSANEPARLVYYTEEGGQLRKFLPYNGGDRVEMTLDAIDFDHDQKQDILVSPQNSLHPVRVWTEKSKKLLTWYPQFTFLHPVKRFFFNE